MLVKSQCLHRAVAEAYAGVCREGDSFHEFLLSIFPDLSIDRCSDCSPENPRCGGENSEYHPNPREFIAGLEKMREGFCEDNYGYTQRKLNLLRYASLSPREALEDSKRFPAPKRVLIDLDLLTGDPEIDRFQVVGALRDRGNHSHDDDSIQDEYDSGIRVA